jgi:hypothetical protein
LNAQAAKICLQRRSAPQTGTVSHFNLCLLKPPVEIFRRHHVDTGQQTNEQLPTAKQPSNGAVVDNLPVSIPVTTAEIEAIENFLGPLLLQILG